MHQDDADSQQEQLTALITRAGLSLSADELANMASSDQRTRSMLQALRKNLNQTEEPASAFSPTPRSDA
jgi:hypothetical protein